MKNKKIISMFLALMILVNAVLGVMMSVSANTDDGIYTETGETYTALRTMEPSQPFYSQSVVVTVNDASPTGSGMYTYVSTSQGKPANTGSKSALITVPEKGNKLSAAIKFTENSNKLSADTKYLQFWISNNSGDNVYISNFKFFKDSTLQYNLKSGTEVQLIDESQKTVVNAARWSLVDTGNENGSRSIKIPADFVGYVRIPVSSESINVIYPKSSEFDASLFAQTSEINFSLGNMGDGGAVYIDDVGYVTGGESAKAGAKFADLSQEMVYTDPVTSKTMAYRIYVPQDYDFITKYPVVLYLHGNGFQGDDNASHVTGDMGEPLDELVSLGNRSDYPCIIVAPQCPTDEFWVNTTFKNGSYSVDTVAETDAMAMALDILADVQDKYSVDTNRTYAMGVSMGAFGCWDIMVRHPGVLDAAVPMMGAGDPSKANAIGNTAIWAFHGATDNTVPVTAATPQMIEALNTIDGTNVKYTEYANHGHDTYRFAVCEEELLPWLFSQGDIYVNDLNEEYNAITGFEPGENLITIKNSSVSTTSKNTGAQSLKVVVGNNTNVNAEITFKTLNEFSGARYVQFWVNNATGADQYLAATNFLGSGIHYNVLVGSNSVLIEDGTGIEKIETWKNRSISGLGTVRSLLIPAGFSGYVRISLAESDFEKKVVKDDFATDFNSITKMSMYIGNTSTGGDFYFDDFGYITDLKVEPDVFAKDINLHINSFGADESFSASIGATSVATTVKEAGNFVVNIPTGTYYKNPVIGNSNQTANASAADYLQFVVNNNSTVDQYIFNFNMYIDSAQSVMYRIKNNTEVLLIDDATNAATQVQCTTSNVSGASTSIGFSVPAGFSGKVRISLDEAGLEVRKGEYSKTNVGKIRFYNFLVGNRTATASTVIFDDFEFVDVIEELPTVLGAQIRTEDNNLRFVMMHNKAVIEELEAKYKSVEYGTIVVNASAFYPTQELLVTNKTTGFGSGNPTTLANKSAFTPEGYDEFYEDYRVYSFVIKGVTGARKDTPIAVRAYIKVTDNEGNEHILYGYDKYKHDGYQTTYNAVLAETQALLSK